MILLTSGQQINQQKESFSGQTIRVNVANLRLPKKDLIYRNNAADIKAIVAVGEEVILNHINDSLSESPTVEMYVSVGTVVPKGWLDFHQGIANAKPFEKIANVNRNDDPLIISFTSGTTGNPKMVMLDCIYPLAHIVAAKYWQKIHPNSLHLTIADTGWLKAVWGKLYGQWIVGACVFVYDQFLKLTGIELKEGYGQSETTLSIFTSPWTTPKQGSMGLPNPHYDIDLLTHEGVSAKANHHLIYEIQEHVKSVTAPYKYPRIIEFVDVLPKTISGKIRRPEIRENDAS